MKWVFWRRAKTNKVVDDWRQWLNCLAQHMSTAAAALLALVSTVAVAVVVPLR